MATLGPGQFEASWFVAAPGPLTVAVTPGAASTPRSTTYTVTGIGAARARGAFHADLDTAAWDHAEAAAAVPDTAQPGDDVTLHRTSGPKPEPGAPPHGGAVLADRTVHADTIAPRSVTADKLSVHDLSAIAAELGSITVDRAHIADGAIDSAKFADTIQSDPFEPGRRGWRVERDGCAEFNDVVISRQLQVDSVSLGLAALQVPRTAQPAIAASWIVETSVPISAWVGATNTYLATAGLDNTSVTANEGDPPDVLFGVQAIVLLLTIWSGPQVLRLKLNLWTQKVTAVRPMTGETWRIDWRLYRVT